MCDVNMHTCCCGEKVPYPTQPGKWRFKHIMEYKLNWTYVEIKLAEEGLEVWPSGSDEPIWWPNNVRWEKLE